MIESSCSNLAKRQHVFSSTISSRSRDTDSGAKAASIRANASRRASVREFKRGKRGNRNSKNNRWKRQTTRQTRLLDGQVDNGDLASVVLTKTRTTQTITNSTTSPHNENYSIRPQVANLNSQQVNSNNLFHHQNPFASSAHHLLLAS